MNTKKEVDDNVKLSDPRATSKSDHHEKLADPPATSKFDAIIQVTRAFLETVKTLPYPLQVGILFAVLLMGGISWILISFPNIESNYLALLVAILIIAIVVLAIIFAIAYHNQVREQPDMSNVGQLLVEVVQVVDNQEQPIPAAHLSLASVRVAPSGQSEPFALTGEATPTYIFADKKNTLRLVADVPNYRQIEEVIVTYPPSVNGYKLKLQYKPDPTPEAEFEVYVRDPARLEQKGVEGLLVELSTLHDNFHERTNGNGRATFPIVPVGTKYSITDKDYDRIPETDITQEIFDNRKITIDVKPKIRTLIINVCKGLNSISGAQVEIMGNSVAPTGDDGQATFYFRGRLNDIYICNVSVNDRQIKQVTITADDIRMYHSAGGNDGKLTIDLASRVGKRESIFAGLLFFSAIFVVMLFGIITINSDVLSPLFPPKSTATLIPTATATLTPTATATLTPRPTSIPTPTQNVGWRTNALVLARQFKRLNEPENDDWQPFIWRFEDNVEMVLVPAGCFMMGSENGDDDEQPLHEQCFTSPFWIDRYEVTNSQIGDRDLPYSCTAESYLPDHPTNCVQRSLAIDHCEGRGARLPTEREWEYAARGPSNFKYPWGNSETQNAFNSVVYSGNSDIQAESVYIYSRGASWVGAHHMAGNLWEWVSTIYTDFPYPYDPNDGREAMALTKVSYVIRGGSFSSEPYKLRAAYRGLRNAETVADGQGFRCVRDEP